MNFLSYIILFVLIYLIYYVFVISRKNVYKKFLKGKEINYLKLKYGIHVNKHNERGICKAIALSNSFIICTTLFIISFVDKFIVKLVILTMCLIVLILFVYHIVGTYYSKKERDDSHV